MIRNHSESQFVRNPNSLDGYVSGRVSVIIPTYNYGQFVLHAIKSALRQNVHDLEIIVVDDGSTDGTSDIINPYKKRIKYIYQENTGLSSARNTGIVNSTGEFIQFLDADDILGPDSITSQLKYLERKPDVYISVCKNRLFKETPPDGYPRSCGTWRLFRENLEVHLCYFNVAPLHAFLSRREAIVQTGRFDSRLKACEDYDYWLRAAINGFVPHYNPLGLVYYRRHPRSMSANLVNQYLHDALLHKRLSKLLDDYPEYPKGHRLEGLLAFSAGAVLTAVRLYYYKLEETHALMELALKRIEEAMEIAGAETDDWNILMKLFFFRITASLAPPYIMSSHTAKVIHDNLLKILSKLNVPISKDRLIADALLSALGGSRQLLWERWQLGKLPLKYLRNRFLPFLSPLKP